ncbi:MAG: amidase [Rhodobacteraceae bacterium]|nr:amidase [Paracoccaceae bacterium]
MDLTEQSARDLTAGLRSGRLSAHRLMQATLERIGRVNPAINAVVSLRDADALLSEARAADLVPVDRRGALHGLPVAVKDLVATKGLRTTFGSPLYADHLPDADDLIAARLRGAGAILIGKTNTPEWGHGSHTFNPVHGVTRNPYDPGRSAGGSSGGAAAALAARMVALADGSDMMGSLRNPAAFCNVYGFRPSWGLVPQDAGGEVFLATLSTDGPMARSPGDLALLLDVLAGPNPEVPFCRPVPDLSGLKSGAWDDAGLKGKRLGWLADWGGAYPMEPGILTQCGTALEVFRSLGATVDDLPPPFPAEALWQSWTTLRAMLNAGSKADLARDPARRALTKPETLWEIERGTGLTAAEVHAASVIRSDWYAAAARLFGDYDALILPAAQVWPFPAEWRWPIEVAGRGMDTYHRWMEVVIPVSLIGLPCLALPAGFGAEGLPTGIQLFGPTGSDAAILGLGAAYHAATDWPGRCPPALAGQRA